MCFVMEVCSFCFSNGESERQYLGHILKTRSGVVKCPVLRSYVCPFCQATGDQAHTRRYCPLNKDGRLDVRGASLTELKKKKNAAGNYPSHKKLATNRVDRNSPSSFHKIDFDPRPGRPLTHHPVTDPLPQEESLQLSLYQNYQYLQFYR